MPILPNVAARITLQDEPPLQCMLKIHLRTIQCSVLRMVCTHRRFLKTGFLSFVFMLSYQDVQQAQNFDQFEVFLFAPFRVAERSNLTELRLRSKHSFPAGAPTSWLQQHCICTLHWQTQCGTGTPKFQNRQLQRLLKGQKIDRSIVLSVLDDMTRVTEDRLAYLPSSWLRSILTCLIEAEWRELIKRSSHHIDAVVRHMLNLPWILSSHFERFLRTQIFEITDRS